MNRALLFGACEGDRYGRACLPVLEREKREYLKSPSNSHRLLFAIVVTIESEEGSFPIVQCQPVLFFASIGRKSAFRWGAELG